jgi:hypothetical protein
MEWVVDEDLMSPALWRAWYQAFRTTKSFHVDFGGQLSEFDAHLGSEHGGRLNGDSLGDEAAALDHVIAHWVGFPNLLHGKQIHAHTDEGWQTWSGRHVLTTHGWHLTLDARADLREVLAEAEDAEVCVLTHVMEVRRDDGATFTAAVAKHLLWGLQCAVSFACGYWTCPSVPVGFDSSGAAVWSELRPLFADPARDIGWWDGHRTPDLIEVIDKYLGHWLEPNKQRSLQFATINALLAVEAGFVEQRLTTAVTGLELLSWVIDIQDRGLNPDRWQRKKASKRLRKLLVDARIPLSIESDCMPGLAAFAETEGYEDGAETIVEIRHRLIHPKDNSDLYAADKALAEASRLACRYLELVLLHRIGYKGHTCDRTHVGRWSGESQPVPWL